MQTCIVNMDKEGLFMSEQAAMQFSSAGQLFVQAFVWLAHEAASNAAPLYRLRPKLHLFDHETRRVSRWRFNPKAVSCFSDEDFIGKMCNIATSCSHQGILTAFVRKYLASVFSTWKSVMQD